MMPKLSVIIPIYGVEKYIERCAISLFEQTLDDIEFIFVDDCTNDNSIQILSEVLSRYPSRISQVKILSHTKNLGQAQSRLTGLEHATGEYVIHCDSDDWVDATLYEKMYASATYHKCEIVVCDLLVERTQSREVRIGTRTTDVPTFILNLLFQRDPVSLCNKLIKRSLYQEEIQYPIDNMGEDMAIVLQMVKHCKSVSYIQDSYYHYDGTTMSITRKETKEAVLSRAEQACRNVSLAIKPYCESDDEIVRAGAIRLKFMQRRQYMPIINYPDVLDIWRKTFPEINNDVLFNKRISIPLWEWVKFVLTLLGVWPIIKRLVNRNIIH